MRIRTTVVTAFVTIATVAIPALADPSAHAPRRACMSDVKKFCGDVRVSEGHAGIEACLAKHESELSSTCEDNRARRAEHKANFEAACGKDVQSFCTGEQGEGWGKMRCLKEHANQLSDTCKTFRAEHRFHRGGAFRPEPAEEASPAPSPAPQQ